MKQSWLLTAIGFALIPFGFAETQSSAPSLTQQFQFLIGDWTAAGETQLGAGEGDFSFQPELNGHVIMRRNFAEYKTGKAAGTRHDDLMLIYSEPPATKPLAIYFDSEGHVIRYSISFPSNTSVVFDSDSSAPGPKYRLSYRFEGDVLNGQFEVAPPGQELKTYLEWKARRATNTPSPSPSR